MDQTVALHYVVVFHDGTPVYSCVPCGQEFEGDPAWRRHLAEAHPATRPVCDSEISACSRKSMTHFPRYRSVRGRR